MVSEGKSIKYFTKIPNEILTAIQDYKFNLNQIKIIMVIWRYTYGFNRDEHEFSLGFLEKSTNLTRARVSESLKALIETNVLIEIEKGGGSRPKVLSLNENYEQWTVKKYASSMKGSLQNDTTSSLQKDTSGGLQNDTQEIKEKNLKKKRYINLIEINGDGFLNIYNKYFTNHFDKQHMKVSEEQQEIILNSINNMRKSGGISESVFEEIVEFHFDNLCGDNNGNILYFLKVYTRYLNELRREY